MSSPLDPAQNAVATWGLTVSDGGSELDPTEIDLSDPNAVLVTLSDVRTDPTTTITIANNAAVIFLDGNPLGTTWPQPITGP